MHMDVSLDLELLLRIVVGTVLGSIIGYERDIHGRPAGLRTHALVALASSTFMVVSTHFVYFQHYGKDDLVTVDSSRIASCVVSGIGFLAGGAILRTGLTIQGLTTAAGLWLVAALGLAAGGGMYAVAVVVTLVGVAALTLLRRFEDKHIVHRRVSIGLEGDTQVLSGILTKVEELGTDIAQVDYEHLVAERKVEVTFDVRFTSHIHANAIVAVVAAHEGVTRVRLGPPS